jgi:hypothetical protein
LKIRLVIELDSPLVDWFLSTIKNFNSINSAHGKIDIIDVGGELGKVIGIPKKGVLTHDTEIG